MKLLNHDSYQKEPIEDYYYVFNLHFKNKNYVKVTELYDSLVKYIPDVSPNLYFKTSKSYMILAMQASNKEISDSLTKLSETIYNQGVDLFGISIINSYKKHTPNSVVEKNAQPLNKDEWYDLFYNKIDTKECQIFLNDDKYLMLSFIVDSKGIIDTSSVIASANNICTSKIKIALSQTGKWIPASDDGKAVSQLIQFPILTSSK